MDINFTASPDAQGISVKGAQYLDLASGMIDIDYATGKFVDVTRMSAFRTKAIEVLNDIEIRMDTSRIRLPMRSAGDFIRKSNMMMDFTGFTSTPICYPVFS